MSVKETQVVELQQFNKYQIPNSPSSLESEQYPSQTETFHPNTSTSPEEQDDEIEESPKPNKYIEIGWFLWHTFDFITDVLTGVQYIAGFQPSLDAVEQNCNDLNGINVLHSDMDKLALILLPVSFIGYVLYCCDAYRVNKLLKPTDKSTWRCLKIAKLLTEDLVSISVTWIAFTFFVLPWTGLAIASFAVSSISLVVMMGKHGIYTPCKNGKHWRHKLGASGCCIFWLAVILGFIFMFFVIEMHLSDPHSVYAGQWTIMMEGNTTYGIEVDCNTYGHVNSVQLNGVYCQVEYNPEAKCVCREMVGDNEDINSDDIIGYVEFESCDTFSVEGENPVNVCFDGYRTRIWD